MTKKTHKKKSAASEPATERTASGAKSNVTEAFASGNYAAVRAFAKTDDSEATKKLVALTQIDMTQVAVGLFAIAVVLTVAFVVLH